MLSQELQTALDAAFMVARRQHHEMLTVEHSNYCPHGRPTRIKLDDRALERLFHR